MTERLREYVLKGPNAERAQSLSQRVASVWLWWRMWAGGLIIIVGLSAVGYASTVYPGHAFAGLVVGLVAVVLLAKVLDDG